MTKTLKSPQQQPAQPPDAEWASDPFGKLRRKWGEVPGGLLSRKKTSDLLTLSDRDLLGLWDAALAESSQGKDGYATRGWYHDLYKDVLRGKKVMDVGSGMGMDGITFAQHGAQMTFVDIVESNLKLLERLCKLKGVTNARFHYMRDIDSLGELPTDYDVIWAQGSLINAPFDVTRREIQELVRHLKIGGRWVELAYPKERWVREGQLPFEKWGQRTDGPATPFVEWYDLEKLTAALSPAVFDTILYFNYYNDDFNWFDLIRRS